MNTNFSNKVGTAVPCRPMNVWDAKGLASLPLSLFLLTSPTLFADPAAVALPSPADPLTEALPDLQAKYVDFKALHYKPGDKLGDLIARSKGGISLVALETLAPPPMITADLPEGILYWRLASFALPVEKSWGDFESQLRTRGLNGIVLDLRNNLTPDDYAGAKQMLGILKPPAMPPKLPETMDDNRLEPIVFPTPIVTLVNAQTSGSAEVLAAALKADGALVLGTETRGAVAQFEEEKLPSGEVLRFVTGPVAPANDTPQFGHPVQPDISILVNDQVESAALTLIRDNHVLDVIQESEERHRLSEASLVQGQDPEYDDYLASLERKPVLLSLPIIHDTVLVSALDSLKAIRLSKRTLPTPAAATSTTTGSLPTSTSIQ
jgi:hypothetical protein